MRLAPANYNRFEKQGSSDLIMAALRNKHAPNNNFPQVYDTSYAYCQSFGDLDHTDGM